MMGIQVATRVKQITHKELFLFGFLFYLVSPLIIHQTTLLDNYPGIDGWKSNLVLKPDIEFEYIYLIVLFLAMFFVGSFLGTKLARVKINSVIDDHAKPGLRRESLGIMSGLTIFILSAISVCFLIFKCRSLAFKGEYLPTENESLGVMCTLNLLIFYINFVIDQPPLVKRLFFYLLIVNSIFLLGLGGRMYVVMPGVAYFMRSFNKTAVMRKRLFPYFAVPVTASIVAGVLGALRTGQSLDLVGYFIFAEPVFTSYSSMSYICYNHIPLVNVPYNFIVSFLEITPSLIWPNKMAYMDQLLSNWNNKFDAPFGALSIFVTVFADFGVLLGGLFMSFLGGIFGFLQQLCKEQRMDKNVYYCFCCVLPFSFFRDPIAIPIKIFLLSFVVLPFLMKLIRQLFKRKPDELKMS